MRLAHVGSDVYVGSLLACDARSTTFDRTLHIWKPGDLKLTNDPGGTACKVILAAQSQVASAAPASDQPATTPTPGRPVEPPSLALEYAENASLKSMSTPADTLLKWAAEPGRLLVHCRGGACRSPTLAVLCLIARGRRPHAAVRDVLTGCWDGYGVAVTLGAGPLCEIFGMAGLMAPWDSPPTMRQWP